MRGFCFSFWSPLILDTTAWQKGGFDSASCGSGTLGTKWQVFGAGQFKTIRGCRGASEGIPLLNTHGNSVHFRHFLACWNVQQSPPEPATVHQALLMRLPVLRTRNRDNEYEYSFKASPSSLSILEAGPYSDSSQSYSLSTWKLVFGSSL